MVEPETKGVQPSREEDKRPTWGAIYQVPLPSDPWQAVPNNRPPDKRSPWGVQNSPVVW
jgi:hypothetical protein